MVTWKIRKVLNLLSISGKPSGDRGMLARLDSSKQTAAKAKPIYFIDSINQLDSKVQNPSQTRVKEQSKPRFCQAYTMSEELRRARLKSTAKSACAAQLDSKGKGSSCCSDCAKKYVSIPQVKKPVPPPAVVLGVGDLESVSNLCSMMRGH